MQERNLLCQAEVNALETMPLTEDRPALPENHTIDMLAWQETPLSFQQLSEWTGIAGEQLQGLLAQEEMNKQMVVTTAEHKNPFIASKAENI